MQLDQILYADDKVMVADNENEQQGVVTEFGKVCKRM
jgi:hypothetical protein